LSAIPPEGITRGKKHSEGKGGGCRKKKTWPGEGGIKGKLESSGTSISLMRGSPNEEAIERGAKGSLK